MILISFILIILVGLVGGQINILEDRTINTKGETLTGTNSYPLIDSNSYWAIDLNSPDIIFELATESSTFNFLITSIVIQTFDGLSDMCVTENIPSQQDYLVSYEIGGQTRFIDLNSQMGDVTSNTLVVGINSIPADRITISKRVNSLGTFCMRYGLMGHEVARVSVLSYGMTLPNLQNEEEYTGLCGARFCFGGKGRLTDGITDTTNIVATGVGWSCQVDKDLPCIFNFRVTLTTTTMINRIELLGLVQGSASYPLVILMGEETDYERTVDGNLFVVSVPIGSKVNLLNLSLIVEPGRNLILTEFAVFTGENVNIAVESESYTFQGIMSDDVSTSAPIANFQSDQFSTQTVAASNTITTTQPAPQTTTQTTTQSAPQTTRVNNTQINTIQNTQQTTQNTTESISTPPASLMDQCMTQTILISIIGVLGIFIITVLLNSIIVVAILAKNNRKIRRKLHALEAKKGESFKLYDFETKQSIPPRLLNTKTIINENMITTDDVYDSLEVPVTGDSGIGSPSNATLQRNSVNPNFFHQSSVPMTESSCFIISNRMTNERPNECPIMDENEVHMEENVAFRDTSVPQICVERCESYKQENLGIPMTENLSYMSSRTKPQLPAAPIQQENLGIPMTENIGYVSSRNGPIVPEFQNGEPKHIYASIATEYCIPIPDKNSEMTGYNVLRHK